MCCPHFNKSASARAFFLALAVSIVGENDPEQSVTRINEIACHLHSTASGVLHYFFAKGSRQTLKSLERLTSAGLAIY